MTETPSAAPKPTYDPEAPPVPGARMALMMLLLINLFNYIDRQVLAANVTHIEKKFLPALKTDEGANNPEAADNKERLGDLALAFMLSYMVFAPIFAWLSNYVGRWKLVGVGVILWSLASGASGLAGTFWILLMTRCFVGIGEAAYGPVAPDIISDLYPVKRRGSVLSWFYVAIPVGGALGYALGGAAGFPLSFFLVVPPGLLMGLCCFLLPEPKRGQLDLRTGPNGVVAVRRPALKDYLVLLKTPSYLLDTLGMTAMTFAIGGIAHWMPDYVHAYREAGSLETVNLTFGVIVVIAGLGATLLGGWVGDRLRGRFSGSYFLVSGTAMLLGFPLFLGVLYTPFPYAWGMIFLACFCLFFNTGPTNTILANVTHPALRAQGFAMNIFIIHLFGDAVSPKVIGMIADRYAKDGKADMNAGFLAVSFMILVGGFFWLWGARYLKRDTELAPLRLDHPETK